MNLIESWSKGVLQPITKPYRLIATPEPNCNLTCEHCYFAHNKLPSSTKCTWGEALAFALKHDIDILCAGRIVTERVINFIQSYIAQASMVQRKPKLSIIDNGYTVFNLEPFFDSIDAFNISIDGTDQAHDVQRNKTGSARVAWKAIQKLQARGFDPLLSSCLSPITLKGWGDFEKEVEQKDVRLAVSITLEIGSSRTSSLFSNLNERTRALEMLATGIPKLIQIYDTRDVTALHRVLGDSIIWHKDENLPGMSATLSNGVVIIYRPHSLLCLTEYLMNHEGTLLTHHNPEISIKKLNEKELHAWKIWKHTGI